MVEAIIEVLVRIADFIRLIYPYPSGGVAGPLRFSVGNIDRIRLDRPRDMSLTRTDFGGSDD